MIKKNILIIMICIIFCCGCKSIDVEYSATPYVPEEPKILTENVECIVKECDYQYWYASGSHFKAYVTIYNEEYHLEESFTLDGMDAQKFEGIKNGDIIQCELRSYWMENSNEVVKRELCLK